MPHDFLMFVSAIYVGRNSIAIPRPQTDSSSLPQLMRSHFGKTFITGLGRMQQGPVLTGRRPDSVEEEQESQRSELYVQHDWYM